MALVRVRARASSNGSREAPGATSVDINPALQLLLSTSGTTGSQKYVRLSRDAIVANAGQIARGAGHRRAQHRHRPSAVALFLRTLGRHFASGGGGQSLSGQRFDHLAELLVEDRQHRRIAFPRRALSLCGAGASGLEPCSRIRSRRSPRPAGRSILAFRQRSMTGRPSAAADFLSCTGRPRRRRA